jgi:opacity protein-like surface antigen
MKKICILFAACLALAAQSASAQDYARPGAYASLNGVTSIETIDGDGRTDVGTGVSGRLGYRFSPQLAVEGQVDWSGDFVDGPFDLTSTTVTANAKFYLAHQQVQPYLLAGIGAQIGDDDFGPSESAFAARVGGGLDFYLSERFGLLGEVAYVIPTGDLDGFDYVSIGWGAFYRF